MTNDQSFQKRIEYTGELKPFLDLVLSNYNFGEYVGHEVKKNGYEDFNLVLYATKQTVFVKCFANWRSLKDRERYLEIIETAWTRGGVRMPVLYSNNKNSFLTSVNIDGKNVHLLAMQFLDGGNIWESKRKLNLDEQSEVIQQAAKINRCKYRPVYYDKDSWAIVNAKSTYLKNKNRIEPVDKIIIEELLGQLEKVDINALPHALVHGDIRSTNVMRHSDKQIYVIDFAVANWYPRIMELAVLFSDILFDPNNLDGFNQKFKWAIDEYTRAGISLTPLEKSLLPLFVRLGHAMNLIASSSTNATNYISQAENKYWHNLGRIGLRFTTTVWKPYS